MVSAVWFLVSVVETFPNLDFDTLKWTSVQMLGCSQSDHNEGQCELVPLMITAVNVRVPYINTNS